MQWLIYLLCPLMMILCMIGMFKGGKKETTPNHDVIKDNESLESLKVQMQGLIEQNKILTKEMKELKSTQTNINKLNPKERSS